MLLCIFYTAISENLTASILFHCFLWVAKWIRALVFAVVVSTTWHGSVSFISGATQQDNPGGLHHAAPPRHLQRKPVCNSKCRNCFPLRWCKLKLGFASPQRKRLFMWQLLPLPLDTARFVSSSDTARDKNPLDSLRLIVNKVTPPIQTTTWAHWIKIKLAESSSLFTCLHGQGALRVEKKIKLDSQQGKGQSG